MDTYLIFTTVCWNDFRRDDTLLEGSARIPVNRGEFPDGAKRGNRARRHHVGGQNDVSAPWCARRKRNEREKKARRDVVFRAAEGGKASNARRRAAKLARGSRLCDGDGRGRVRNERGRGGGEEEGQLLLSYTRLNNIPISISEK